MAKRKNRRQREQLRKRSARENQTNTNDDNLIDSPFPEVPPELLSPQDTDLDIRSCTRSDSPEEDTVTPCDTQSQSSQQFPLRSQLHSPDPTTDTMGKTGLYSQAHIALQDQDRDVVDTGLESLSLNETEPAQVQHNDSQLADDDFPPLSSAKPPQKSAPKRQPPQDVEEDQQTQPQTPVDQITARQLLTPQQTQVDLLTGSPLNDEDDVAVDQSAVLSTDNVVVRDSPIILPSNETSASVHESYDAHRHPSPGYHHPSSAGDQFGAELDPDLRRYATLLRPRLPSGPNFQVWQSPIPQYENVEQGLSVLRSMTGFHMGVLIIDREAERGSRERRQRLALLVAEHMPGLRALGVRRDQIVFYYHGRGEVLVGNEVWNAIGEWEDTQAEMERVAVLNSTAEHGSDGRE